MKSEIYSAFSDPPTKIKLQYNLKYSNADVWKHKSDL